MSENEAAQLSVGDAAPEFTLSALTRDGEKTISLADYKGKKAVVLYFYPKDDTPGCTKEACAFRDLRAQFDEAGAEILGISADSVDSHDKFAAKFTLPFPLLSDPDHAVADKFGAWKEKTNYGRTYWGIQRSTFVIDKTGIVRKIWASVKVDEHAEKVLEIVKGL
ncbi:MAG: thioredoxin-dependent thiol peroxidase [Capsulimonadaceae bacterium]|nr:thioredoxin-dependent thiol peroxidase [Capsulimonadaceae bacterium]